MAALEGRTTDRLCWSPLICPYFTSSLRGQGYLETTVPEAARLVGADVIERHVPCIRLVHDDTVVPSVSRSGSQEVVSLRTPIGELTSVRQFSSEGQTWYLRKHAIENAVDIDVYRYVSEHSHYEEGFGSFRERDRLVGQDGIATSTGPVTPIQAFYQDLCGIENTVYLLADHPERVEACFRAIHERNMEAYTLLAEGPAPVVIDYEDTSSTSISPFLFETYCFGAINDYARIVQRSGKIFITHMCGTLRAFYPQIRAGLQYGVDSVCPPETGDTWADEARAAWGDDKCILGGLDPTSLAMMTPDETEAYALSVLERMPTFRKFILSTGDATAYGTPVENLRRVTKVVAGFGWR